MSGPAWHTLPLDGGILREASPDAGRLVLWLPGARQGGYQLWERVGNVPAAPVVVTQGLCATAATAMQVRQQVGGFLAALLQPFRKVARGQTWILPRGGCAEQLSERQTDLLLVWPQEAATPLDETRVRACWPQATRCQRLGSGLFLVGGIDPQPPDREAVQGTPLEQAEQVLAAARQGSDRRREAAALADLGVAALRGCAAQHAVTVLHEALTLLRQLGNCREETDVLCQLGLAVHSAGEPRLGLAFLDEALASARAAGDRCAEKLALDHLGVVLADLGDHSGACAACEQALAVARVVGDRQHQADLLWALAIQHAELGERDQALAAGQAAADLLAALGSPHVAWLEGHLQGYRASARDARLRQAAETTPRAARLKVSGWSTVVTGAVAAPSAKPEPMSATSGPGLLRMAISAVKSMARFLGSGAKTVSSATHEQRVATCATCAHHTGLRCRVCGCFTAVKAWVHHERCPLEKWPE